MRLLRCLLVSGTAVAAAGALTLTAAGTTATVAGAPVSHARAASHAPSASYLRDARAALVSYLHHNHPTAWFPKGAGAHADASGTSKAESFNWAGYADTSTSAQGFSKVSGKWTTPKVSCTKEDTLTSEWVGIDGYTTSTVEQDGTLDWCFEGKATYFTWYEMYPAGTIAVGKSLKPGDKISASVTRHGTSYTLKVTDSTHKKNTFTKTASCAAATCLDESVEWIAERPAFSIGIAPLADFHSWTLTSGAATGGGKSGAISSFSPDFRIASIDATETYDLATTSGLTTKNKFKTTWHNSY